MLKQDPKIEITCDQIETSFFVFCFLFFLLGDIFFKNREICGIIFRF
jgi:hypothetical protein